MVNHIFKKLICLFLGGPYCGWGCTHNMLNMLITIDIKTDDCDCRCIQACFWSAIVGLLIAIWSKWEWQALCMMRSSLAESSEWRCISMGLERTAAKNCHQAYITIPFVWTWRTLTSYICLQSKWVHLVKSNCKNSS